jgi:hypothetical protein
MIHACDDPAYPAACFRARAQGLKRNTAYYATIIINASTPWPACRACVAENLVFLHRVLKALFMKLYFSPGACSLSPYIILRETDLAFGPEKVTSSRLARETLAVTISLIARQLENSACLTGNQFAIADAYLKRLMQEPYANGRAMQTAHAA